MSSNTTTGSQFPNRWIIAVAAFCMQLALGAVYAWSVFLKPVIKAYGAPNAQANFTFSVALLALGVTAGFGGYLNSRFGPRAIATVAGVIYGAGIILAGFAAPNVFLLYLTYGIIGGIGLGLGYIVALAMLIKWFPDRRGFITGLAVAGFGGGAALTGPIAANYLLPPYGLSTTFIILGIIYLVIVVGAAQFFPQSARWLYSSWLGSRCQAAGDAQQTRLHFARVHRRSQMVHSLADPGPERYRWRGPDFSRLAPGAEIYPCCSRRSCGACCDDLHL